MHHLTRKQKERETIANTLYGDPKTLIDVKTGDCKWIVDGLYCCAPIDRGSFCKRHAPVAYVKRRKVDK